MAINVKKTPGDPLRSADWNVMVDEINRLETDKVNRRTNDRINGNWIVDGQVGAGVAGPQAQLHVKGGQWNVSSTEGDFKIGNATYRLKMGIALAGVGAGHSRIRAQGGNNSLTLGGGTADVLTVVPTGVGIGTTTPSAQAKLQVQGHVRLSGGAMNLVSTEGDFRIGSDQYRLKIGVDTAATNAGDVYIRAHGGTNRLMIGGGTSNVVTVNTVSVGIGTVSPNAGAKLEVNGHVRLSGGRYNITSTEGDFRIGNDQYRLKIGVDTSAGGAGNVYMRAHGGTNALLLGGGTATTLTVKADSVSVYGRLNVYSDRIDVARPLRFTSGAPETFLYYATSISGAPTGDGCRIRYESSFFGANLDALVFEKTDRNTAAPDGGIAFVNTGSNGVVNTTLAIRGTGRVGIGTKTPAVTLHVVGNRFRLVDSRNSGKYMDFRVDGSLFDITCTHPTASERKLYVNTGGVETRVWGAVHNSSRDSKEDIAVLSAKEASAVLDDLSPVRFGFKGDPDKQTHFGFIAEETPLALATSDRKAVDYNSVIGLLASVVKEQQQTISELRRDVEQLAQGKR